MPAATSKAKFISVIISHFSRGERKRTPLETLPRVRVDSSLMSWGLLSNEYGRPSTSSRASVGWFARTYHYFSLIFQWLMVVKWLTCIYLPPTSPWIILLGDFTAFLPGERIYYHVPLTLFTLSMAMITFYFYWAREKQPKRLSWLKPFEVCKGSINHADLNMSEEQAAYFWRRTWISLWLAKLVIRVTLLGLLFGLSYIFGKLWPQEAMNPFGMIWAFITLIWVYYLISIHFGMMTVFHQVCYYLFVGFEKVNKITSDLELTQNVNYKECYKGIHEFMREHNEISSQVSQFNSFWHFFMSLTFCTYIPIICFIINLTLFGKVVFWARIILLAVAFILFGFFCIITFSAGFVAEAAHDSYSVLNSISQIKMPVSLKTQLQIYIQRLGGPTIGFSCWDLFTVTYDTFFHALLMIGTFFLLLMDVMQSGVRSKRSFLSSQK